MEKHTDYAKIEKQARIRSRVRSTAVHILLSLWAVIVLFPFYWMVLTSVKSYSAYNSEYIPKFFTLSPTLQNYVDAFTAVPLGRYFTNTLVFTLITTLLMLSVITLAAFAFARLEFKGKRLAFTLLLSLMMIPNELVIITNFVTITDLGLRNTFTGLILPSVTSVFYIYLLKENFAQIPDELYYAAKVDGTSDFKYLWKVMVPMARPSLMTIILLNGLASWNSFMWPMYVIVSKENRTLPWGLQVFTTEAGSYPELLMAASTVVVFPVVILFLFARKYIVRGVARGGLKG